jgi:hypothetical protein
VTDLTDRMRTCAAHIMRDDPNELLPLYRDAAALLIEASNALEVASRDAVLGDPMEIIEPPPPGFTIDRTPSAAWIAPGGPLPGLKHSGTVSMRTCPKCDSRVQKTARRVGDSLMLKCPVCGHQWTWRKG